MNNKRSTVLSMIKKLVKEIDPKAEIILYGSRARGDERPDSDWDLLILVNSQEDLSNETKFRHKLFDLELELEESFSITVHNKNKWESKYWVTPLYKNINREGVRI
jgi:predicted nucleotidyltransferase